MRLGGVAAGVVLASCATTPQPLAPAPLSLDPLPWKARAAFDSTLAAGDTARLADLFAPNAFVIEATGDTLPVRAAMPRYLDELRHGGRSVQFSWGREGALESCIGGGREHLTYAAHFADSNGASSELVGQLAIFWTQDSTGAIKVAWIALSKREMTRRLKRAECPSRDAAAWNNWRWAVSVAPLPGLAISGTPSSFVSVLRQRGWTAAGGSRLMPPSLISVQYHVRPHVVAEILGGRSPRGTIMGAQVMPNRDYALTRLWYSGAVAAALLSYEHAGLQIGTGLVVQVSQWRMRDSVVPFSTGGEPSFHDTTWSSAPLGVVGDVAYRVLVSPHAFVAFRAHVSRVAYAQTPATPRLAEVAINQGGSFVGIGVGFLLGERQHYLTVDQRQAHVPRR